VRIDCAARDRRSDRKQRHVAPSRGDECPGRGPGLVGGERRCSARGGGVKASLGVLTGTLVFEPTPIADEHGFKVCTFDVNVACAAGLDGRRLVHETQTRTSWGGVRGLHVRTDGGMGLLVHCAHGAVVDVAVDLRPSSPTYRLWMTVVLDDVAHRSVWLPAGLAHGYQALSDTADVCVRVTRVDRPERELTIRYDDPELDIPWPLPVTTVSARDNDAPALAAIEPLLGDWFGALV
jgi:dTDP-4-dehydrorhamnose 3,5-epimerase